MLQSSLLGRSHRKKKFTRLFFKDGSSGSKLSETTMTTTSSARWRPCEMEMQTSAASTFNVVKNGDAAIYSSFIESQSGSRRINQLEIGTPEREFSLRSSPKKRHNNETGGKVSDKRISRLPQSIKQPFKSAFYFSPLSLSSWRIKTFPRFYFDP